MSHRGTDRTFWSGSTLVEQNLTECSASSGATGSTFEDSRIANTAGIPGRKNRLDFTNVIEIHVGEEGCCFVPKNRLVQRSKFFRDRCRSADTTRDEFLTLDLAKEDRFLFDTYLQVLYQDEVILPLHVDEASEPQWCIRVMLQTYMLAGKLKDMRSCNIIVDSLISFCSRQELVFEPDEWDLIFHDKYQNPALRKLAVDFCVIATDPDVLKTQLCQMPTEMAIDCVARFADLRHEMLVDTSRGERPDTITSLAGLDRCKHYHQHDVDSCPRCPTLPQIEADTETPARASAAGSPGPSEGEFYYPAQQQQ